MASPILKPITADTTLVTADAAVNSPVESMSARLQSLVPSNWFSRQSAPFRDAVFAGLAIPLAWLSALISYTQTQTRLSSANSYWLDLAAYDFFGLRFQRRRSEADASFSARIRAEIIRPRSTRAALSQVVQDISGIAPDIYEPFNPLDCGAYGDGSLAYGGTVTMTATLGGYDDPDGGFADGGSSYGSPAFAAISGGGAGRYGSLSLPNQIFLTVHRPPGSFVEVGDDYGGYGDGSLAYRGGIDGTPAFPGLDDPAFGYDAPDAGYGFDAIAPYSPGGGAFAGLPDIIAIPDDEIYAQIANVAAGGVIVWTSIKGP